MADSISQNRLVVILDESCVHAIGSDLDVEPIYGWGWVGKQPKKFRMALRALEPGTSGGLIGGWGQIHQPSHPFDQHFVVFKLHNAGSYNFTSEIAQFVLDIYPQLPETWRNRLDDKALQIAPGYVAAGYAYIKSSTYNDGGAMRGK